MPRKTFRIVAVLALMILTFTGIGNAAVLRARGAETPRLTAVWERIAGWLRDLQGPGLTAVWGAEGSQMDPNGTPQSGSTTDPAGSPNSDEGSQMDPDGR